MTPGARVQAAIECLDQIIAGAAAEQVLSRWARGSRFAGSKDRAAVRDHVFDALRARDSYAAHGGALSGRAVLAAHVSASGAEVDTLFSGQGHAPAVLNEEERSALHAYDETQDRSIWNMPDWAAQRLQSSHGDLADDIAFALRSRAPVDLRVNLLKTNADDASRFLEEDGVFAAPCGISPTALRVQEGARKVKTSRAYAQGHVELQDAGSQALVSALPLRDGHQVLDYCAGGGGKSLAMAAQAAVRVTAHDANPKRMNDLDARAERAGITIARARAEELSGLGGFDLVLCDVPCSGSGAWRRNPDGKWRMQEAEFTALLSVQSDILEKAQSLLKPKAALAYVTCSLFDDENTKQIERFLSAHPEYQVETEQKWTPLAGSDGFYLCLMRAE